MPPYAITAQDTTTFTATHAGHPVGSLHYAHWFGGKAHIELPGQPAYAVRPKGFWGTTIAVWQQARLVLDFKLN